MTDIFISYKSERKRAAEHMEAILKRHGYSVWFDYELVKGRDFAQQIDTRIRAAKALVVLWCTMSIRSEWVREEAHLAKRLGILIPVKVEDCELPFGFGLADTIDLSTWDGDPRSHALDPLIDALEKQIGRDAAQDRKALIDYAGMWRRFGAPSLKAFALGQAVEPENGGLASLKAPVTSDPLSRPAAETVAAPHVARAVEVHPYLAAGYEDRAQRLVRTLSGHTSLVSSVAFSPDGRSVLSGSYDNTLKLFDASSGKELRSFSGHSNSVTSVAFSPDGRSVLSGSRDKTLKLFDASSGQELRTFSGHTNSVTSVAFSPDGRFVLSGSYDDTIKLWDAASGQELRTFTGHTSLVTSVAFSPDGRSVLSGSGDNTLKLFDASSGKELRSFSGHTNWVNSVAFSPDGRFVLSGSFDNTIKLFDASSGKELRTLSGHTLPVYSVAFSPDGRYLVSGAYARNTTTPDGKIGTIKLWVASTGQELHEFTGHGDDVKAVAFSPDGRFIVSGSDDNTCKLWDVSEWTGAK